MRKLISLLICCLLFGLAAAPAYGADSQPTVSVKVTGKQVTIEGTNISANSEVTLLVKDPQGQVAHIDQTASDSKAFYKFQFAVGEILQGNYTAQVGGRGIVAPAMASFVLQEDSSPGTPPGGPPTPPTAPPDMEVVNETSLRSGQDGKVVIEVSANRKGVLLPAKAASVIGDRQLDIKSKHAVISIPPEVMQAAAQLAVGELAAANLSLTVEAASSTEASRLLDQASENAFAELKLAGEMLVFDLSLIDSKSGKAAKINKFEKPLTITFAINPNAKKQLVGVYYISDNGELEYRKGEVSEDGRSIRAVIEHFSTYAVMEYSKTYLDVPEGHWVHPVVKELSAKHIVSGVSTYSFAPGQHVTRAEFTALLSRLLDLRATGEVAYDDVGPGEWYAGAVAAMTSAGIVQGVSEQSFAPHRPITREELATMLIRAYHTKHNVPKRAIEAASFADRELISEWAADAVSEAYAHGLINGYEDKTFKPKGLATRAEAAQVIYQLLNK